MKTKLAWKKFFTSSAAVALALNLSLLATLPLSARADTYTWAYPTVSGTWDATGTFASGDGKWLLNGSATTLVPGYSGMTDDVILGNGTDALTVWLNGFNSVPATESAAAYGHSVYNSLVIKQNTTVNLVGHSARLGFGTGITNAGIIQIANANRQISLNSSGGSTNITNSGTIQTLASGTLMLSASVINTGGLIAARANSVLNIQGLNAVSGGEFTVATSATVRHNDVNAGLIMTNVTTTNDGTWLWDSWTGGGGRTKTLTVSGGSFTNTGLITLMQFGDSVNTGTNYGRALGFTLQDGAIFTNSGTINILNSTPDNKPANEFASFTGSANVGAFTNSGLITITNAATNTDFMPGSNQTAGLTVNNGSNFTNTGTISVRVDAAAADIVQHSAVLSVSSSWNNTGVVLIDSGGKTAAYAALNLTDSGRAYTQSGADSLTRLANGGQINAGSVTINSGTLAGSGVITTNLTRVTINSGATLDPDGVLTLNGGLVLAAGGVINFSIDDGDLLNVSGDINLGGSLNLTDSADGRYLFMEYGGSRNLANLTISGLAGYEYELDTATAGQLWLNITAIPEPATWALLLGGAALLFTLRRRA